MHSAHVYNSKSTVTEPECVGVHAPLWRWKPMPRCIQLFIILPLREKHHGVSTRSMGLFCMFEEAGDERTLSGSYRTSLHNIPCMRVSTNESMPPTLPLIAPCIASSIFCNENQAFWQNNSTKSEFIHSMSYSWLPGNCQSPGTEQTFRSCISTHRSRRCAC